MAKGDHTRRNMGASYHDPDPTKEAFVDNGIYLAKVINNKDEFFDGSIDVEIPALHRTTGKKVKSIKKVRFATPFGGISNIKNIKPDDTEKFENTQQSYGMWFNPPDIGSMVLVAFADGNRKHGYVISHVLPPQFNHMLPGIPHGKSFQGGNFLTPVAEKNKYSEQDGHINILRPIHHHLAEPIVKQGLINDTIRGIGDAGARRETPSMVTGILTKGARGKDGITPVQAGHQFIMDDEPKSAAIRIRSGKGQQILLDDATGTIYAINKDGKGWIEMDFNGNINVFGEGDINLRAKKNFNLRADYSINIEAGHNIRMKAAGDNVAGDYLGSKLGKLGLPPLGTGGNINFHAAGDMGMLATRNAQLSAIGGDIDINSGNMLKTQSGTATSISATTMGIDISAKAGIVAVNTPAAIGLNAGADVGIAGAMIRLNTGPGVVLPGLDVLKVSAPPLDGVEQEDQPSDPPEYDKEGDVALTSGGIRPGGRDKISTIVGTLITAEPYDGHAQFDPTSEDKSSMEEDASADAEVLPGQTSPGDEDPADKNTPDGGTELGNGFKDAASGALGKASEIKGAVGGAIDAVGDAVDGALGKLTDMMPNFEGIPGLNNFLPGSMKDLMSLNSMEGVIAALGIAIPAFRFPTGNALGDKIIGYAKELRELEAQLGQFSLDGLDLPIDLDGFDIGELKGKITDAVNTVTDLKNKASGLYDQYGDLKTKADKLKDGFTMFDEQTGQAMGSMGINSNNYAEVKQELSKQGIDLAVDGPSLIFTDRKTGHKIVDISNGIGPIGTQMALRSDLKKTHRDISEIVTVDLSDNQLIGLTSFANHIGINNFAGSELLIELNKGNYADVPKYMRRWRTGKVGADSVTQVRQDYIQRREYEIEIFTTPDWLGLTPMEMGVNQAGNLSFRQLRALLRSAKEKKYIELGYKVQPPVRGGDGLSGHKFVPMPDTNTNF